MKNVLESCKFFDENQNIVNHQEEHAGQGQKIEQSITQGEEWKLFALDSKIFWKNFGFLWLKQ